MRQSIENKIRINAIVIYAIAALVCVGVIVYFYSLRNNAQSQKEQIEQYYGALSLTNELIHSVNLAQAEANLYVASKGANHFKLFRQQVEEVEGLINALDSLSGQAGHSRLLEEIGALLREKGHIVLALNKQFATYNPLDPINKKLQAYRPATLVDSLLAITTIQDTTISAPPRKSFWTRFAEVFSPDKTADTVITTKIVSADTLRITEAGKERLVSEMAGFAEEASINYTKQITAIERQVANLIAADHEISQQISTLLIKLQRYSIDAMLEGVQESERLIRKNYTVSVIGGSIALLLILVFILLIINDVNKGYAARKALEQANERTRQLMESRHRLLLAVSHDIKTPLNSILGYLELWQSGSAPAAQDKASMQNSGKHILALLNNLLEFSGLEQGSLTTTMHNFKVYELCSETAGMFAPLAGKKQLTLHSDFSFDRSLRVCSDALKIKQIIGNLLSNAIKYTPAGNIEFHVAYHNGCLHIRIGDTGAGIPAEKMNSLFQPFSRVEENNKYSEGSGFGLYVVKGLVELLEGTIAVDSAVGKGTTITVAIPAKETDEEETGFRKKNILVIDDDTSFLTMLKNMLAKLGHHAETRATASEFEQVLNNLPGYDAVLTDMEMGAFSGTEVRRKVKAAHPALPVIIMTARSDFDNTVAGKLGFDGFLQKPVTMDALAQLFGSRRDETFQAAALQQLFGNDTETIAHILQTFVDATGEHIAMLQSCVANNDFKTAQSVCHKMLPMFMQLGAEDITPTLKKMDASRVAGAGSYPQWRGSICDMLAKIEKFIGQIRESDLSGGAL